MALLKKLIFGFCLFWLLNFSLQNILAVETCSGSAEEQVACYTRKISETKSTEKTLSSQIDLINNQISLTRSQINVTQNKLDKLTDNISSVSGKIVSLEDSLTQVSHVLANRITQTYIIGRNEPFLYLLSAGDFSQFWQRFEYLRIVQKHDKEIMLQMAASRKNYNDQKEILEDKKKQVETLSAQLLAEKARMDKQTKEKQILLEVTHNDEARYQQLLAEAQAQLAAFQGFVALRGGGILSNQTKCDDWGCYYNQRDSQWGNNQLNRTGYTLADSGCLVTSMAMIISHYGHKDVTPVTINNNPSNFAVYFPAFLNYSINAGGSWSRERISRSQMDEELNAGRPVVVGIGPGPSHFVVMVNGSGDNYTMNDPYVENGSKISFTSKYSLSSISQIDKVRQN